MITVKFRNMEKSDFVETAVYERIEPVLGKFPVLEESGVQVTLEMENSPVQAGPDLFTVRLRIAGGRYDGVAIKKANSNVYVALAEVADHMLEKLNRFGDRSRVKARSRSRKMVQQTTDQLGEEMDDHKI
jgi:ribosome-associated translation inhibitor RaiA